jgi:hypothetical protein
MAGDDTALYKFGLFLLGSFTVILCLAFAFEITEKPSRLRFSPTRFLKQALFQNTEKIFTAVLAIATVALVGTAIKQHYDTIDAINATNRFAKAAEDYAAQSKTIAAATASSADATIRLLTNNRAWIFIKYGNLEVIGSDATQRFIAPLGRFSLHNYGNTVEIVKSVEPHMFYIFVGNPAWHVEPDPGASSAVQWRETETPFVIEESPQPGRVVPDPSAAMSREYSADQVVIPPSGEINLAASFTFENVVIGSPQMSPEDVACIWPRRGQHNVPGDT